MADKLLVRAYNVGCGDCTYVRIPGPNDGFHMLIDCGRKGGAGPLKGAIEHLETQLPQSSKPGQKRLDLLVATHRHEDHIKGLDPEWFANIEVKKTWLSVAMKPDHPQAEKTNKLHAFAAKGMRELLESGRVMSPDVEMLASLYRVNNDAADRFLFSLNPEFVHAGLKNADRNLGLPPGTALHVLGPEEDIDGYYLGAEADASLRGLQGMSHALGATAEANMAPRNISAADFELLQSRMLSNSLAFAAKDSSIQNNLSVVLLLEWKRRRLLFVGDAEWDGEFGKEKHNGSWNVMWHERKPHLSKPVDFLKIGHHGSTNATPHPPAMRPQSKRPVAGSIYEVLDSILPVPRNGKPTAQALVSTEREFYNPIPECALLVDLAQRVRNTRKYGHELAKKKIEAKSLWATDKAKRNQFFEKYEAPFLNEPQPWRTDLEAALNGSAFVDVEIAAGR